MNRDNDKKAKGLTGKRNIAFIRPRISPFQYSKTLADWERFGRILKANNARLIGSELGNVGMLFELKLVSTKLVCLGTKEELDTSHIWISNLEVHISLEFHGLNASIAK